MNPLGPCGLPVAGGSFLGCRSVTIRKAYSPQPPTLGSLTGPYSCLSRWHQAWPCDPP